MLNRRRMLKTLVAGLAMATAPTLPTQARSPMKAPAKLLGFGREQLMDVLDGRVAARNVHQLLIYRPEYAATIRDVLALRDNGRLEEYGQRLSLLKQLNVDWLPDGDNRYGWMPATPDELACLPRNRARFFFDYEGSLALAAA